MHCCRVVFRAIGCRYDVSLLGEETSNAPQKGDLWHVLAPGCHVPGTSELSAGGNLIIYSCQQLVAHAFFAVVVFFVTAIYDTEYREIEP